ncbi:SDR family oxidoreductase [Patescibacteria group bacterium]|nr:SDR family oxidoreductase [Patescibacteria group bacterium]MBU1473177.1 SDR family oxidoreductase [Patescibacteria group bacterium]MBU2457380.1 SDR family oxidoreductase [Planctomycetota bacterium]MBU2544285.1 SDR family oxidoreductase [Patescibacteria group bacterium]
MDTAKQVSVVTGGAGFIGSNLCEALLTKGHAVYCIDNLLTGSEKNIEQLKSNPSFTFMRWDVTNEFPVLPKIDYIFHLASPASVADYQKYDEETALVNSMGTRNLLKFAKAYQARFLFTSTSEIYGDPKEHPQKETYWGNVNPNGVRSCYDESKRFGEMMVMLYSRKHRLDARIVRIFNTYGPKMRKDDGRVISNFINQAIAGHPITVYGDGTQTRSFCYVADMVEGILKAMFTDAAKGEVINLGNPEEYTMIDLATKIQSMTASSSEIVHTDLPEDDPVRRRPDITKARKLLEWEPKMSLDTGLAQTIAYYKSS